MRPDGQVCTATRRVRPDTTARAAVRPAPVATEPTATVSAAPASALQDSWSVNVATNYPCNDVAHASVFLKPPTLCSYSLEN